MWLLLFSMTFMACQDDIEQVSQIEIKNQKSSSSSGFLLPDIDLNHWYVALPINDSQGKLVTVYPPEILNYATNPVLNPYMYNDSTDGSLVFYTVPGATTTNSTKSRTELREQIVPGNNYVNWKFEDGARMRGRLVVPDISRDANNKYHSTYIMQIHGILSAEQMAQSGTTNSHAPPILKIKWQNGKVRINTKYLKDTSDTDIEIQQYDAWGNLGQSFDEYVGHDPFTLEVEVLDSRMSITLNDNQTLVYDDVNTRRWAPFDNYFKAGNYFTSRDSGSYAYVKYYELEVDHTFIKNSGFDNQGSQSYKDHWLNPDLGGPLQITAGPVHEGLKSGKLPAYSGRVAYQRIPVKPNTSYAIYFHYTMKTSPVGSMNVAILSGHVTDSTMVAASTITSKTFTDQSSANTYVPAWIYFNSGANEEVAIYITNQNVECRFDSFSIVKN